MTGQNKDNNCFNMLLSDVNRPTPADGILRSEGWHKCEELIETAKIFPF